MSKVVSVSVSVRGACSDRGLAPTWRRWVRRTSAEKKVVMSGRAIIVVLWMAVL